MSTVETRAEVPSGGGVDRTVEDSEPNPVVARVRDHSGTRPGSATAHPSTPPDADVERNRDRGVSDPD